MKDFKPEAVAASVKTFGDLVKGDLLYAIANEPFSAPIDAVVSVLEPVLDGGPAKSGNLLQETYVKCSRLLGGGIMILKSADHQLVISPNLTVTSDRKVFQDAMRHTLTPRLMKMKEVVKQYEELLSDKIEVVSK